MGIYKQCSVFELFDSVQKTPYGPPLKLLTPRGPPRASKYPKMGVGSIVWGIFLHVYFLASPGAQEVIVVTESVSESLMVSRLD